MSGIVNRGLILIVVLIMVSCKTSMAKVVEPFDITTYTNSINQIDLRRHLYIIASDSMQGRNTGEIGQIKARDYITDFYSGQNIGYPKGLLGYYQQVPSGFMKSGFGPRLKDADNILAFFEGTEKPEEIVVISAHYDHIGIMNGEVFNGADDNGSGTVALLELAEAFNLAKKQGYAPKRSVLFLHVIGEEHGLHGSRFYTEHPIFPLQNTVVDINIDMVGRIDDNHTNGDYIYVIGSDRLSSELHDINERINQNFLNLTFDYRYNERDDPNRFYFRSDHYNFAKYGIPSIFFFNGTHADYHGPYDEAEKINYQALERRTKHIFRLAWELANMPKRIIVDKSGD